MAVSLTVLLAASAVQRPYTPIPRSAAAPLGAKKLTVFIDAATTAGDDFYWREAKIHSLGNTGLLGRFHALLAPVATHFIDSASYGGRNVRKEVHQQLGLAQGTVLDLCCGVGISTAPGAVGVDASEEMIDMARLLNPGKTFLVGNAENFGNTYIYI